MYVRVHLCESNNRCLVGISAMRVGQGSGRDRDCVPENFQSPGHFEFESRFRSRSTIYGTGTAGSRGPCSGYRPLE